MSAPALINLEPCIQTLMNAEGACEKKSVKILSKLFLTSQQSDDFYATTNVALIEVNQ
jgi:hypothetical protein